jgi:hypothetical protein
MSKFIALVRAPPPQVTANVVRRVDEELRAGKREIYVHYPLGMRQYRLVIPAAKNGDCTKHEHHCKARSNELVAIPAVLSPKYSG